MKTLTKIILVVLTLSFLSCQIYTAERNNPFDPRSKNSLYYIQLLSGSGISGLIGTGSGTSTGTSTGTGTGNTGKPDLQLVSFDPPITTMLDSNIYNSSVTVKNAGNANASAFYVGLYLRDALTGMNSDNYYCTSTICPNNNGSVQVSSLAAGESTTLSIPLNVATNQTTGINYIGVYLDPSNSINESIENNNYGSEIGTHIKQVTIAEYRPDITLISFTPPNIMTRNTVHSSSVIIKNNGTKDITTAFYVGLYLRNALTGMDSDNYYCKSTICPNNNGSIQVSSLGAGASTTLSIPLKVETTQTTGINYIGLYLDPGMSIQEFTNNGESNNYGTAVGTHIKQVTVN